MFLLRGPARIRAVGECQIVVARFVGDFGAEPCGPVERRVGLGQFQFGDDESGVLAGEFIHFERVAGVFDVVPRLADAATDAQREQRLGVGERDRVVELR